MDRERSTNLSLPLDFMSKYKNNAKLMRLKKINEKMDKQMIYVDHLSYKLMMVVDNMSTLKNNLMTS